MYEMKNKILFKVLLAFTMAVVSACSVSPTANTEVNADTALVKGLSGWNPLSVIAVHIYSVDDKKFKKPSNHQLSPGKHIIEVRCSRETPEHLQNYYRFDMKLEAGHVYKPKLDMTKGCYVDYVDVVTGQKYIGVEQ